MIRLTPSTSRATLPGSTSITGSSWCIRLPTGRSRPTCPEFRRTLSVAPPPVDPCPGHQTDSSAAEVPLHGVRRCLAPRDRCGGARRRARGASLVPTASGEDVLLAVAPADGGGDLRLEPAGISAPVAKAAGRIRAGIHGGFVAF